MSFASNPQPASDTQEQLIVFDAKIDGCGAHAAVLDDVVQGLLDNSIATEGDILVQSSGNVAGS